MNSDAILTTSVISEVRLCDIMWTGHTSGLCSGLGPYGKIPGVLYIVCHGHEIQLLNSTQDDPRHCQILILQASRGCPQPDPKIVRSGYGRQVSWTGGILSGRARHTNTHVYGSRMDREKTCHIIGSNHAKRPGARPPMMMNIDRRHTNLITFGSGSLPDRPSAEPRTSQQQVKVGK